MKGVVYMFHKYALTGARIGGDKESLYKLAMIYEHNYRNTYEPGTTG